MSRFFAKVEKYLIRSIVLGLVALVLVQGLMTQEPWRLYLSWGERLEGQNMEYPASSGNSGAKSSPANSSLTTQSPQSPQASISLSIDKFSALPRASILVNGEIKGCFNEKEVKLEVSGGDVLEVDSTYYNFPVDYHITEISQNMAYPKKDRVYTANQSIVMIGKVIVK